MTLRPVLPMNFPDATPAKIASRVPEFIHVDPTTLLVDDRYQRSLNRNSVRLIRKIIEQWDWSSFKPPVAVEVDGKLNVIDGQHTAIAAASHGGIKTIPVMVVSAEKIEERATSFVRHNRDRIGVTAPQLHAALVAAGDQAALTINRMCESAGIELLKYPPQNGKFRHNTTIAITTIGSLLKLRSERGALDVLSVCAQAKLAPVSAGHIKAVDLVLFGSEYGGMVEEEGLVAAIIAMKEEAEQEAARFALAHKMPRYKALAAVWFRNCRKKRKAAS